MTPPKRLLFQAPHTVKTERVRWVPPALATLFALSSLFTAGGASAQFFGLYTDAATYEPGQSVQVHGSAPSNAEVILRLVRVGAPEWVEVARSEPASVGPVPTRLGSFLEVEGLEPSARAAVTLEASIRPTVVGGDEVVIAGQRSAADCGFAIGIDAEGRLVACANESVVVGPAAEVDRWTHVAARFDGSNLELFVDGARSAGASASSIAATLPFRVGARAEAPGDQTGLFDGRIDSVALWPVALGDAEIAARANAALTDPNPAPPAVDLDLWLNFEDTYPAVVDGAGHTVRVINHGQPAVAGPAGDGRAFGLHRDQIVDAGWPISAAILLPADAPSGLYSVEVLTPPDYVEDDRSDRGRYTSFVVRPARPEARIAVIVPVFTWMAYSEFPGSWSSSDALEGATPRSRTPGGEPVSGVGNNSVYGRRGDGVTQPWFSGWRRPDAYKSVLTADDNGYSVRSAQSRLLAEWLDTEGRAYDVYTDWDLSLGRVPTDGTYRVLIFHGHHEYWSDEMIAGGRAHLEAGGSTLTLAGNLMTWRVTFDGESVIEVRKYPGYDVLGPADTLHAMDGSLAGSPFVRSRCIPDDSYRFLGVVPDYVSTTCERPTDCFGRWQAEGTDHWLWQGSGARDGDEFGRSPVDGIWTVGHEADSFIPDLGPPGLMPGTEVQVLASGGQWGAPSRIRLIDRGFDPTCAELTAQAGEGLSATYAPDADERAGNIVYYRHRGGGHVFTVGATASAWSLGADPHVTGLVRHALDCFADDVGCGEPSPRWPEPVADGCGGCRTAARSSPAPWAWLLLALGVVGLRVRRRRRAVRSSA